MESLWKIWYITKQHDTLMWAQTGQTMYVQCSVETRSRNHWCRDKTISITYSEYVFLALVISIKSACVVLRLHLCPVWVYHIFPHYLINSTILGGKILNTKYVLISSTTFVWNISHSKKKWTKIYCNCTFVFMYSAGYASRILMELLFCRQIFRKVPKYPTSRQSVQFHADGLIWRSSVACLKTQQVAEKYKTPGT